MQDHESGFGKAVIDSFGFEGYGVMWALIEMARADKDYIVRKNRLMDSHKPLVRDLINLNVFSENGNDIRCDLLDRRMERQKKRIAAGKKAAMARWGGDGKKVEKQPVKKPELDKDDVFELDMPTLTPAPPKKKETLSETSKRFFTDEKLWAKYRIEIKKKHSDMPLVFIDAQKEKFLNFFDGQRLKSYKGRFANWLTSPHLDPYAPDASEVKDEFLIAYMNFSKSHGVPPKIDKRDMDAIASIRSYLVDNSNPDGAVTVEEIALHTWETILANWNKVDPFIRKNLKLEFIDRNMMAIIKSIKSHGTQSQKTAEERFG